MRPLFSPNLVIEFSPLTGAHLIKSPAGYLDLFGSCNQKSSIGSIGIVSDTSRPCRLFGGRNRGEKASGCFDGSFRRSRGSPHTRLPRCLPCIFRAQRNTCIVLCGALDNARRASTRVGSAARQASPRCAVPKFTHSKPRGDDFSPPFPPFLPSCLSFFLFFLIRPCPKRTSVVSSRRTKERRERERANVRKNVGAVRRCAMKNVQGPKAVRASEKGPLRNGSGYRFNKCLDTVLYGYECRSTATNLSAFSLDVQTKGKITGWS